MFELLTALFFLRGVLPEPTELQKYKWEQERRRKKIRNILIGVSVLVVFLVLIIWACIFLHNHIQISVKP